MDKVTITQDAELQSRYPTSFPCRIEITNKNGQRKTAVVPNPIGHHDRPMSDEQIVTKFRGLAGRQLPLEQVNPILDRLWKFETENDLRSLFEKLSILE